MGLWALVSRTVLPYVAHIAGRAGSGHYGHRGMGWTARRIRYVDSSFHLSELTEKLFPI